MSDAIQDVCLFSGRRLGFHVLAGLIMLNLSEIGRPDCKEK